MNKHFDNGIVCRSWWVIVLLIILQLPTKIYKWSQLQFLNYEGLHLCYIVVLFDCMYFVVDVFIEKTTHFQ